MFFYFDYLGTIEGNQTEGHYPLEDIRAFLQWSPQKRLIFATTFCCRAGQGVFDDRASINEQNVKDFLEPLFKWTQWKIVDSPLSIQYHREKKKSKTANMIFYLYVLEKDQSLNPNDAVFIYDKENKRFSGYSSSWKKL